MTRTDTWIDHARVDNRYWAYWAECHLPSPDTGIFGVSVRYVP